MTQFVGNPVRFLALPAVHVEGNPVTFRLPRAYRKYVRPDSSIGKVRSGIVGDDGVSIIWLTPPP